MNETTEKCATLDTALGGRRVAVEYRDGTAGTIVVREVQLRQLDAYCTLRDGGSEVELLTLVTGEPNEALERISLTSTEALLAVAEEINGPFAAARQARLAEIETRQLAKSRAQLDRLRRSGLIADAKIEAMIAGQIAACLPGSSAPSSSPPPA